jgi:aspartate/methionine/tyrosine aminotransferase
MQHKHSEYMHWAKTGSTARFNLATSGVGPFPMRELPFDCGQLEINGNNSYGYPPLKRAIAEQYGVDADCVVTAEGTSMANYLAMATLLEPGDEVIIEHPAYGLLEDAALYAGATVKRFARAEENGYEVDPAAVRRAVSAKTRLIVVTNLHNPSSVLTSEAVLRELADIARSVEARLLVDEVYLDAVYEGTPRSAFHIGREVIVTNSLTKVYGLSGLRCGWVLAEPELARAMYRLNNIFGSAGSHPGELLSVAAFQHLGAIRERARRVVEADRAVLTEFLDANRGVSAVRTAWGTTSFFRLVSRGAEEFVDRLREEYETSVAPGRFFGMPEHFRVGMGVDAEMFREGLRRVGEAMVHHRATDTETQRKTIG